MSTAPGIKPVLGVSQEGQFQSAVGPVVVVVRGIEEHGADASLVVCGQPLGSEIASQDVIEAAGCSGGADGVQLDAVRFSSQTGGQVCQGAALACAGV